MTARQQLQAANAGADTAVFRARFTLYSSRGFYTVNPTYCYTHWKAMKENRTHVSTVMLAISFVARSIGEHNYKPVQSASHPVKLETYLGPGLVAILFSIARESKRKY